jgi:hypothetical protein
MKVRLRKQNRTTNNHAIDHWKFCHFSQLRNLYKSRSSSLFITLNCPLDSSLLGLNILLCTFRFRFPTGAGNFSLYHRVQNGFAAHTASYPMGTRGSFPGVKRPGREADHLPPSNAEVKMSGATPLLPQYAFMTRCLVKHRDNFTFTFPLLCR